MWFCVSGGRFKEEKQQQRQSRGTGSLQVTDLTDGGRGCGLEFKEAVGSLV